MQTEHLQNVRLGVVGLAWLIAVALASLLMIALLGLNLIEPDSAIGTRVALGAVALGFFAGGLFAGLRSGSAPMLHGVLIGLLSLVVWFVLNLITAVLFKDFGWQALTPNLAIALVLVQIVAAILGARSGYRRTRPR
ncbi:MAG TPA: hypothetical protein VF021_02900 [Longimicrobiales bacterium]